MPAIDSGLTLDDLATMHEVTRQALLDAQRKAARPPLFGGSGGGSGGGEESAPLLAAFRAAGWKPDTPATIGFSQFRAATWTGSLDALNADRREAAPLGADRRYAYTAFIAVPEDAATTSVQVLTETARALPAAADVVRSIADTSQKPEVGTTRALVTVPMKQVAAVETEVPNVILAQPSFGSIVQVDLRLAYESGLDKVCLDALATAPFHDPGTDDLLVSIRKAITVVQDAGYNPDTVLLDPASAEALDLTTTGADQAFVFASAIAAGSGAPPRTWTLRRYTSKAVPAPIVLDALAFGKLYAGPIDLRTFEENAGSTNTSTVRFEGNAAFGAERLSAAVRIAAA